MAKQYENIDFKPTQAMADAAEKGLKWREEHNRGGTDVGVNRAKQLMKREELSPEDVKSMYSYFARHEVDKDAKGFRSGEEGYPSAGLIAWQLWGGDAGQKWVERVHDQLEKADAKDE
jgi:hypothetical protein